MTSVTKVCSWRDSPADIQLCDGGKRLVDSVGDSRDRRIQVQVDPALWKARARRLGRADKSIKSGIQPFYSVDAGDKKFRNKSVLVKRDSLPFYFPHHVLPPRLQGNIAHRYGCTLRRYDNRKSSWGSSDSLRSSKNARFVIDRISGCTAQPIFSAFSAADHRQSSRLLADRRVPLHLLVEALFQVSPLRHRIAQRLHGRGSAWARSRSSSSVVSSPSRQPHTAITTYSAVLAAARVAKFFQACIGSSICEVSS